MISPLLANLYMNRFLMGSTGLAAARGLRGRLRHPVSGRRRCSRRTGSCKWDPNAGCARPARVVQLSGPVRYRKWSSQEGGDAGRDTARRPWEEVVADLGARYFTYGTRSWRRAVDHYVWERARHFLRGGPFAIRGASPRTRILRHLRMLGCETRPRAGCGKPHVRFDEEGRERVMVGEWTPTRKGGNSCAGTTALRPTLLNGQRTSDGRGGGRAWGGPRASSTWSGDARRARASCRDRSPRAEAHPPLVLGGRPLRRAKVRSPRRSPPRKSPS